MLSFGLVPRSRSKVFQYGDREMSLSPLLRRPGLPNRATRGDYWSCPGRGWKSRKPYRVYEGAFHTHLPAVEWTRPSALHTSEQPEYRLIIPVSDHSTMGQIEAIAIRLKKVFDSMGSRRQRSKPEPSLCPSFAFKGKPSVFRSNCYYFLKV